ncbi:MAG: peptide deformylase [Hyphomicrobiales bacterium]|nr:peptide deformylase [Hyphomicrobiales bacterium]
MAIRPIITLPDPVLRKTSQPVEAVDDETRRLIADMFDTMYDAPGIGLAAPQIGVLRRVLVLDDARGEEEKRPIAMINPEILGYGDESRLHEEGCLSIPDMFAEVERPASVTVRYVDERGLLVERVCEGLLATIVQHEVDHLNGVLFIDHLSRLRRELLIKKFYKTRREAHSGNL